MTKDEQRIFGLEQEKKVAEAIERERTHSDGRYAIKLAEKAIFALVSLISFGVATALVTVAINYLNGILK